MPPYAVFNSVNRGRILRRAVPVLTGCVLLGTLAGSAGAQPRPRQPAHHGGTHHSVAHRSHVRQFHAQVAMAGVNDPSGQAMPIGDTPWWHQVMADDFTGNTLDSCWGAYQGVPGSSPTALWNPSHVVVGGGMADLQTYRDAAFGGDWVTGGMSSAPCVKQTYGMYKVRFRMDKANGVKYAIMLWPSMTPWPCGGEVDYGEDPGGNRSSTTLTVHYCDSHGSNATLPPLTLPADFSAWHTLGVQWLPGKIVWMLDGKTVGTIVASQVPSDAMQMNIQAETNTNCSRQYYTCIDSSTPSRVHLNVDWVVEYAMTHP